MGCINFGAPENVIKRIAQEFGVTVFIETGTHLGSTSSWAATLFEQVVTIEGSAHYHDEAKRRHAAKQNIRFLLGDSRILLRDVVAGCRTPAIFWLDAHWMGVSNVFGDNAECPVLEEIALIRDSGVEHFILIDDARLFLGPPPLPHRAEDWPEIGTVLSALNSPDKPPPYTTVHNDVIISLPAPARAKMRHYFQEQATLALETAPGPSVNPVVRWFQGWKRQVDKTIGRF